MVALGYIPSGSIKKALEFVRANSAHLKTNSISCYRELIEYYTTKECDPTMACQLYNEMMQKNWVLPRSEWHKALKLNFPTKRCTGSSASRCGFAVYHLNPMTQLCLTNTI